LFPELEDQNKFVHEEQWPISELQISSTTATLTTTIPAKPSGK
jgi:hypothetical protein